MRSANRALSILTVVAASVALAAPAMANLEVDRIELPNSEHAGDISGGSSMATSFTAQHTGELTQVDLPFTRAALGGRTAGPNLTIGIYEMTNGLPGGSALASERPSTDGLTEGNRLPVRGGAMVVDTLSVSFARPAQVTAGNSYAIVASIDSGTVGYGGYRWYAVENPPISLSFNSFPWAPGVWDPWRNYAGAFTTYVDTSRAAGGGATGGGAAGGGSSARGETQQQLRFTSKGADVGALVSPGGSRWMELPRLASTERAGGRFLGWSTSPDFPVDVAAKQVADGGGAIDATFNGERMIFIPAGGSALITGDNQLYAIWE